MLVVSAVYQVWLSGLVATAGIIGLGVPYFTSAELDWAKGLVRTEMENR
jgi:hypothetical protein